VSFEIMTMHSNQRSPKKLINAGFSHKSSKNEEGE